MDRDLEQTYESIRAVTATARKSITDFSEFSECSDNGDDGYDGDVLADFHVLKATVADMTKRFIRARKKCKRSLCKLYVANEAYERLDARITRTLRKRKERNDCRSR